MKKHSSIASWVKLSLLLFQSVYNALKLFLYPDFLQLIFAYLKSITEADAVRFSALSCSALFAYVIITQYKRHTNTV